MNILPINRSELRRHSANSREARLASSSSGCIAFNDMIIATQKYHEEVLQSTPDDRTAKGNLILLYRGNQGADRRHSRLITSNHAVCLRLGELTHK